ncbi:hypothetical protein SAMN06264364_10481 [Quadrisphaera granulorum]|uniref:Lysophospholipase L1-like esterase n=1 Tax=Quadrisphaera granulorum TaxID=317664 RepID=A0A316ADW9_9ACTN|nr:hypothetical protein [Quadrisphaera granulorum]PWJ55160.1 hypothetical protein BXY45_10481 [Quadrisphaera granulorum]SZE95669.1 hypothetical protein SAMN06264364_10481 [Quadrisphaera granulorum]
MLPTSPLRRVQIAATGVLALAAVALVGWLLFKPAPAVEGAGTAPAGSVASVPVSGASTAQESNAAPEILPSALPSPTLTATLPTSAAAGPEASVAGGAPVVFVGDGLDPAGTANDWSALAATALAGAGAPVERSVAAADGAGWAARSSDGRTFADLVDQVVTPQTRVLVLLGSRNDLAAPTAVGEGAERALRVARDKAPQAEVVIVGPPALGDTTSAALASTRRALSAATAQAGVVYLDPVATGGELDADATTTTDGSVRLTAAGQVQLANQVLPVLQRLLTAPAGS